MAGRIFERYPYGVEGQQERLETSKRQAIRDLRRLLLAAGDGARGSVRSGAAGGPLIWQGRNAGGKIVAEEL